MSVVVPVHNGERYLGQTLDSLAAQEYPDFEVLVVDDGSTDGTPALIAGASARFEGRLRFEGQAQAGPAAARNHGLRMAEGELVAFIDADVLAEPGWLAAAVARLDREAPEVAGVEGATLTTPDGAGVPHGFHAMLNTEGGLFMTCNMLYRRQAVVAAGGFDERFRRAFYEDSDLAFGVMEQGGRIVFEPAAVVRHRLVPVGSRATLRDQPKFMYAPLLYRKHPALYGRHIAPTLKALGPLHLDVILATVGLALALATREWWMAGFLALAWLWFFGRVRHLHRVPRGDLVALLWLVPVPFVRVAAVIVGAIRFRCLSRHL
ncbi:MAG: glycosyltransferase family 2 protein [Candidatus Dormibacteria bacterium]